MGPVLVCIGSSPTAQHLVAAALLHAQCLGVDLVAVHVRSHGDPARDDLALRYLQEAQRQGARVVELSATDVVNALVNLARAEGASLVVLGKPLRSTYRWPDRSIADRFIEGSQTTPVLLVGDPYPHEQRHHVGTATEVREMGLWHIAVFALCTVLLMGLSRWVPPSLSLLGAALAAIYLGRALRPGTAALVGVALGFVPALHVAMGASPQTAPLVYLLVTPGLVGLIGGLVSRLQARIPEQEQAILEREGQVSRLHALGGELAATRTAPQAWSACSAALRTGVRLEVQWCMEDALPGDAPWLHLIQHEASRGDSVGCGTQVHPECPWLAIPVGVATAHFGWLLLHSDDPRRLRDVRALLFIGSAARLLAVTLERLRLSEVAEERRIAAASERLRSDLLSAVSHDLRTPLGTIMGAASWLRDSYAGPKTDTTAELLASIEVESSRLERTLDNLLALTRLSGRPEADRSEWVMEEEIICAALERLGRGVDRSRVSVTLSDKRPLLAVDPLLVELALSNLIDNAFRHGGPHVTARISSHVVQEQWVIVVSDDGRGIPHEEREVVFDPFIRGRDGKARRGSGLGLAICRAVAAAHGGTIALLDPLESGEVDARGTRVELRLPTDILPAESVVASTATGDGEVT